MPDSMDSGSTALAFYGLGAAAIAASLVSLRGRLLLSSGKHPSLAGHARIARRLASLIPFYQYGEERFFCADDAPADVATRRRAGLRRLSALYQTRFAKTAALTDEAAES